MLENLITRIREHRNVNPERRVASDQLIELAERIALEFTGEERERLLVMVQKTFDNLVEIGNNKVRARAALRQIKHEQQRLAGLVNLLLMKPTTGRLH